MILESNATKPEAATRVQTEMPMPELRGVRHQSTTAVKTRVHWLDEIDLATARIAEATDSPTGITHLATADGKPLCQWMKDPSVYDATRREINDLCDRCIAKKRKMIRAHRELTDK